MKRSGGLFGNLRTMTVAAMLTAISIVIGIFCKNFMNFGGGLFRVTFENLPIIIAGIAYGPLVGGVVGVASDLVSYLLSSQTYPPNLIVTLGAFLIGASSGIVSKYVVKKNITLKVIFSGAIAHILGSLIVKSIGLFAFYQYAVLWRIPIYFVVAPIEIIVILLLYKNRNFRHIMNLD